MGAAELEGAVDAEESWASVAVIDAARTRNKASGRKRAFVF